MKIIWSSKPSENRKEIGKLILSAAVPDETRAAAYFDDSNREDHTNPAYSDSVAFHVNLEKVIVEISPSPILELMESGQFDHFFWFSKSVTECPNLEFEWILEHEIQHFRQSLSHPQLESTIGLVKNIVNGSHFQFEIPAELDAECAAYRAVILKYGEQEYRNFVKAEKFALKRTDQYWKSLEVDLRGYSDDWSKRTLELLWINRELFSEDDLLSIGGQAGLRRLYDEAFGA